MKYYYIEHSSGKYLLRVNEQRILSGTILGKGPDWIVLGPTGPGRKIPSESLKITEEEAAMLLMETT